MKSISLGDIFAKKGMEQALEAKPSWSAQADAWLASLPSKENFTSETLTEAIGYPSGTHVNINSNNAVGAKMRMWAVRSLIVKEGYTKSTNWRSHGRIITNWRKV